MARKTGRIPGLRKERGISVQEILQVCTPGATETSVFDARCAFWNYALLERSSINFSHIERVAKNYPGHDLWKGKAPVFVVGAYADKAAKSIEGTFEEAIFCHLSPFHVWDSGAKFNRIENVVYMRPCTARHFGDKQFNWIFHNILERTDCPQDWLAAASASTQYWCYVGLDSLGSRRMSEIGVKDVVPAFPAENFQGYSFDHEWVEWHEMETVEGKTWSNSVNPTLLFIRKESKSCQS